MADADDHEKDVEELDERMQKLTHKLENARRDMVSGAASSHTPSARGGRDVKPRPSRAGLR